MTAGPISPSVRDPGPFTVPGPRRYSPLRVPPCPHAGGSPTKRTAGIPERHAAVVQRVLTPSPGRRAGAGPGGRGLAAGARGRAGRAGPWRPRWHGRRRRPPAYTAAKFRLRPELVPIRDAFPPPPPLWPGPAPRPIRLGRARPRPAEPSPPARAPTSPASGSLSPVSESASAPGPSHGAERAHPPSFSTFANPCREARPAGGGRRGPRGRRRRLAPEVAERGCKGGERRRQRHGGLQGDGRRVAGRDPRPTAARSLPRLSPCHPQRWPRTPSPRQAAPTTTSTTCWTSSCPWGWTAWELSPPGPHPPPAAPAARVLLPGPRSAPPPYGAPAGRFWCPSCCGPNWTCHRDPRCTVAFCWRRRAPSEG